ncbi:hypothetical protein UlMin_028815 [Ulmus minor]
MNPRLDKVVRATTVVATVTVSYFLLTADYGPEPNVLDPVKKAIQSAETSVKEFIFGPKSPSQENKIEKGSSNAGKEHP